ncbi:MAG: polysulfide reductase NrfD [Acetobacteraceae bacterium]|nr:polysulfide reductase NrfD [Acetobacteraceae bacterium]
MRSLVRRGRYLSLIGTGIGPVLLIIDLHTPRRFYNMLRIFKPTSPMSIGSYILSVFSVFSALTGGAQFIFDRAIRGPWRWIARIAQVPAAGAGGGMSVYTASLLASTSTPLWAASPRWMAVRFGSSSVASAAAALALGERWSGGRGYGRKLDALAVAALSVELYAAHLSQRDYQTKGVWGDREAAVWDSIDALGGYLPLALYTAGFFLGRRGRTLSEAASLATLVGGLAMRLAMQYAGQASASDPRTSLRFAQPENLPRAQS